MTQDDMQKLRPGDLVEHAVSGQVFVVTVNYGYRVTAVRTADITNAAEWHALVRYAEADAETMRKR